MPCFVIKKNPTSVLNPWLGIIPRLSEQELFGQLGQITVSGGHLVSFRTALAAFKHIETKYPEDVGRMQVFEIVEGDGNITFTNVPWPDVQQTKEKAGAGH